MRRCYRRPGIARPIDDMFALRAEKRQAPRLSPCARRERIARLIDKLIARNDAEAFGESCADRRGALRQPADERPFHAVGEDGEPEVIWLEDVSRTGMRFRSIMPLACGAIVSVDAPNSFDVEPIQVRIIRSRVVDPLVPERGYEYGAEYVVSGDEPHRWYLATRAKF